jgi:hypothetical protein
LATKDDSDSGKARRPKKGRRLANAAPVGTSGPFRIRSGASSFSEAHVDPARWEKSLRGPQQWLVKGASLLRASSILRATWTGENDIAHAGRAAIIEQVILLAALAVENALKGIILYRTDPPAPLSGKFPNSIAGHSLELLAAAAGFATEDAVEIDALDHGEDYIEWIGRYPTATRPQGVPAGRSIAPGTLFAAYARMFHRIVELVAREVYARGHAPPGYTREEWVEHERAFYLQMTAP